MSSNKYYHILLNHREVLIYQYLQHIYLWITYFGYATSKWSIVFKYYFIISLIYCRIRSISLFFLFRFSIWVFFHEHSRITLLQGKGERIYLTPHYHFHLLHRHLDISWVITAQSSPLHLASIPTQTRNLWFEPGLEPGLEPGTERY